MAPAKKAATAPKSQEPEAPFDLDAAVAEVGNEDSQPPFKFSFGGKVWTMRDATDSDARLLANIELNETQQVMAYMRDLLADQWDDFGLLGSRQLTWRRFSSLMHHLPAESAFKAEFAVRTRQEQDEQPSSTFTDISDWSLTNQLLAHVVDVLAMANYQRGGGKGSKPKLLTAGSRRSAKPAPNVDVRGLLESIAPDKQEAEADDQ